MIEVKTEIIRLRDKPKLKVNFQKEKTKVFDPERKPKWKCS